MSAANALLIAAASGFAPWKGTVRTISLSNITLSGQQTVAGVALIDGDRCAVNGQTAGRENGLYKVKTGAWVRDTDFSDSRYAQPGSMFLVTEGDYQQSIWRMTTPTTTPVLGKDALVFENVSRPKNQTTTLVGGETLSRVGPSGCDHYDYDMPSNESITLPAAQTGDLIIFHEVGGSTFNFRLTAAAGYTIEGGSTATFATAGARFSILLKGTDWRVTGASYT